MHTYSNPISTHFDTELLYALARHRYYQFDSYCRSLHRYYRVDAHDSSQYRLQQPSSEQTRLLFALSAFADCIGDNRLSATDLQPLIVHLQREDCYRNERRCFYYEDDRLYLQELSETGEGIRDTWVVVLPFKDLLHEMEALLSRYQDAEMQHVSIEKGLLPFLGASVESERVAVEVLARTQYITSFDVAKCWWMIIRAIQDEAVPIQEFERFIAFQTLEEGYGSQEFMLVIENGGKVRLSFVTSDCYCALENLVPELQKLVQRFHASAEG